MSLYKILQIHPDASLTQIKKAYYKLSKIHHPDKQGNNDKFLEINTAYTILSNISAREIYHDQGLEAAKEKLVGTYNKYKYANTGLNRGSDTIVNIDVSLESFYKGDSITYEYKRKCLDRENIILLTIELPAGSPDKYRILIPDMAHDVQKDISSGDLIIYINQLPHHIFERSDQHLVIEKEVELTDALCGFTYTLLHLDGQKLIIQEKQLKNYKIIKCIRNLGMCSVSGSGDLIIYYNVLLPQYKIIEEVHPIIKILLSNKNENSFLLSKGIIHKPHRWHGKLSSIDSINQCRCQ